MANISKITLPDGAIVNFIDSSFYDMVAEPYSSIATYQKGDFCIYQYELYECINDISTPEQFNNAKWNKITITDLIRGENI